MIKITQGEYYATYKEFYIYIIVGWDWEATIFDRFVDGQFYGHRGEVQAVGRNAALQAAKDMIDDNFSKH